MRWAGVVMVLGCACGGTQQVPAPGAAAGPPEAKPTAAAPPETAPAATPATAPTAPFAGCTEGERIPVGEVCLRPATHDRSFRVGEAIEIEVSPKGCWSSTGTILHYTGCSVSRTGRDIAVESHFCFGQSDGPSTADCSGGGSATCTLGKGLKEGTYRVTVDGARYDLAVPGGLGPRGWCRGDSGL